MGTIPIFSAEYKGIYNDIYVYNKIDKINLKQCFRAEYRKKSCQGKNKSDNFIGIVNNFL